MQLNETLVGGKEMPGERSLPGLPVSTVLLIACAFLVPVLFYFGTARSMVAIWDSSETFAHGYIILPISLWLVWRRRANFSLLPPTPYWPALLLLLAVGFGWLLARMGEVQVVMQYAFAAMFPVIALAILGRRLAWSLAFPLLFLLLAVPFGEIFIDPLISFTADFTVWALQATGIPVLRNGTRFDIPSGSWSVVEACSGIRYLISSVTLGCLYAYLTYRSTTRRALFMVMAVVVPIIANGLRAYMIVMIGHLSGMTAAVGVDHLVYGWFFFGLVMFLLFWVGNFWREDQDDTPAATSVIAAQAAAGASKAVGIAGSATASKRIAAMTVAIVAVMAIWPLYARYSDHVTASAGRVQLNMIASNWVPTPAFSPWVPVFAPAEARIGTVSKSVAENGAAALPVGMTVLYYRNQTNGKSLISSSNRLVSEKDVMHQLRSGKRLETVGTRMLGVRESVLQGPDGAILVWQWYWVGNQFTANDYVGKLLQAKDKLLLRGDDGAAVLLSTPLTTNDEQARAPLRAFLGAHLPAIEATLVAARSR
ncbi:MAG: exosortase A [Pseudomonadota bacterium]